MLRVYPSKSAARAKDYFKNELILGDYYSEGQEIAGVWGGKAAEMLNLSGTVEQKDFNALVDNQYPDSTPLKGENVTPHNKPNRRPGYDINFHAPKSLTLLYEYSQDPRLLEAFRDAVHNTMDSIEEATHTRVRKGGKNEDRKTSNLAYAEFVHYTARPVDDKSDPDPHLHAHCYTMNLTYDPVEEQWKAGQFGEIKGEAYFYEALFHSHLSKSLTDLGLDIARDGKFWTIEGIDQETLKKFAHRREQIEEKAKELGVTSGKGFEALGATTRGKKQKGVSRETLREKWWNRLDEDEKSTLDKLSKFEPKDESEAPNFTAEETMEFAIKHRFEKLSVAAINRIKETALRQGFGDFSPEELDSAFKDNENLILVNDMATTKEILSQENQIIAFTREGYGKHRQLNPDYHIGALKNHSTGEAFDLKEEQPKAVQKVLNSRSRVQAIQGKAGTGKTTTLAKIIDGIEQASGGATVLAPYANTAYKDLRKDGEDYQSDALQNATTLASYFQSQKRWEETRGNTLIVDEAGLMSVDDMHTLFSLASKYDNRVLLVGDISQHNSVMRGDAYRILQEEAGLKPFSLEKIYRQKGDYKNAVKSISEGKLEKGFNKLDDMGNIKVIEDEDERYKTLAQRYADAVQQNSSSAIAIAPTHAEGDKVTDNIRAELKDRKIIDTNKEQSISRYKNTNLTEAEKTDSFYFKEGQMVRFQQNAKGEFGRINRSDQFTISRIDKNAVWISDKEGKEQSLDLTNPKRFNVYETETIPLASGDSIRITEGHKSKEGKQLNNGSIYQIKDFTKDGEIKLDNGFVLDMDKGNFDHGYVTTSVASQGKTVQHVFLAQGTEYGGAASAEQFYVSVSRGKKSVEIFTDDKELLRDQIQRSHQRQSGTELIKTKLKQATDFQSTKDNVIAQLEYYARQFMDTAQNWLSQFNSGQSYPETESTKWREIVAQQQMEKQQDKEISL